MFGPRVLLSDLASFYLIPFFVGAVVAIGWDWRLLVLGPLIVLASQGISSITSYRRTWRIFKGVADLCRDNPHWRFTQMSTADYLKTLHRHTATPLSPPDESKERDFARSILSTTEFFLGDYLRFVVVDPGDESALGNLVTFSLPQRAWIFLNESPDRMNKLQHFSVLHEIGHTDPLIVAVGFNAEGHLARFLFSSIAIAILIKWDVTNLSILAVFSLTLLSMTQVTMKWLRSHLAYFDEIYADMFAVRRCPKHFFEGFSDEYIKDFANAVSDIADKNTMQTMALSRSVIQFTEEQKEWRRHNVANEINRLLRDEASVPQLPPPKFTISRFRQVLGIVQEVTLIALLIALGLRSAELTTIRFAALILIFIGFVIAANTYEQLLMGLVDLWDTRANIISSEIPEARKKVLDSYQRGAEIRDRRVQRKWQHLETLAKEEDDHIEPEFVAPGLAGYLFDSDELDIHVNKVTNEATIFHGKVIDYDISHLEYYSQNHSVVVVMKDQTRFDLGVMLPWKLRPYFLKAKKVKIVRTIDRKPQEEVSVPLRKAR